jgi:hypothetical protein
LKCYSGLGSQTQHVESSVKDSNHCGTIGRTETHQTHLAIHRSGLVTKIRELTRKKGEEAHRQKTGRGYNEKNHKMKCKGSSKIFATITVINERFERLNKARQEKSTKILMQSMLSLVKESFAGKRQEKKREAFDKKKQKRKETATVESITRKRGIHQDYDVSPFMQGCVQFGKIVMKSHLN